jgi:type II secretory pathway pseudopilin PulG
MVTRAARLALGQGGFTYIGLLIAVAILGLMLTVVGRVWSTSERREREIQLLFVGHEFRNAIAGYFQQGRRYPQTLQDLLGDPDTPIPQRYLRRLYVDPMTGGTDWQLISAPGGGIMGVASASQWKPFKYAHFDPLDEGFADAQCYCAWQFVYVPRNVHRNNSSAAPRTPPIRFSPKR